MVQATFTGMAFSIDSNTIDSTKKATIAMINKTLRDITFEKMDFKDKYFIDHLGIHNIIINE